MRDLIPTDPAPLGRAKRVRPDRTHVTRGILRAVLFVVLAFGGVMVLHSILLLTIHDLSPASTIGAIWGGLFVAAVWGLSDWLQRQKRRPPE